MVKTGALRTNVLCCVIDLHALFNHTITKTEHIEGHRLPVCAPLRTSQMVLVQCKLSFESYLSITGILHCIESCRKGLPKRTGWNLLRVSGPGVSECWKRCLKAAAEQVREVSSVLKWLVLPFQNSTLLFHIVVCGVHCHSILSSGALCWCRHVLGQPQTTGRARIDSLLSHLDCLPACILW